MPGTTTRGGFRYPLGTEPPDTDGDMRKIAEDVDAKAAIFDESATRPAAGVRGRLHRDPATGEVTWDTGTAWELFNVGKLGGKSAPLYLLTSDANAAYARRLGRATKSTGQTGIGTTETDLADLTVTFTNDANRIIKVTAMVHVANSGTVTFAILRLRDSSGTIIQEVVNNNVNGISSVLSLHIPFAQVSAGTRTWRLTLVAGAGTVDVIANAGRVGFLLIEDTGVI